MRLGVVSLKDLQDMLLSAPKGYERHVLDMQRQAAKSMSDNVGMSMVKLAKAIQPSYKRGVTRSVGTFVTQLWKEDGSISAAVSPGNVVEIEVRVVPADLFADKPRMPYAEVRMVGWGEPDPQYGHPSAYETLTARYNGRNPFDYSDIASRIQRAIPRLHKSAKKVIKQVRKSERAAWARLEGEGDE